MAGHMLKLAHNFLPKYWAWYAYTLNATLTKMFKNQ